MNRYSKLWLCALAFVLLLPCGCIESIHPTQRTIEDFCEHPGLYTRNGEPFWWGVSTSSYQFEDRGPEEDCQDFKTDWDLYAEMGKLHEPRGECVKSYTNWDRDLRALQCLGVSHFRFSIEWARVEPQPGVYNEAAIKYYVAKAKSLRDVGITPVVALWHFTFPSWLANFKDKDHHGWLHPDMREHWEKYVRRMVTELAPYVTTYAPQNEPNMYALAVLLGYFPPGGSTSYRRYKADMDASADAFIAAAHIIREVQPGARVISIQNIIYWERDALDIGGFWYKKAQEFNLVHLDRVASEVDWIGFNYYAREIASPVAASFQALRRGPEITDLGWFIDAKGLERTLIELDKRYHKPLVITENGIADHTDIKRPMYLLTHLRAIQHAIAKGCDVRGYFHWTLCDDFEWHCGYEPKFGLFSLSKDKTELFPKDSAELYRLIIRGSRTTPTTSAPMDGAMAR